MVVTSAVTKVQFYEKYCHERIEINSHILQCRLTFFLCAYTPILLFITHPEKKNALVSLSDKIHTILGMCHYILIILYNRVISFGIS
jgi:hypothetical protein